MATPPMLPQLPRRLSLVVGGVTAAAASKHRNIFSYSLGPDSGSSSSSRTRSRSSRRFSSNAEQSTRSRRWWYDEAQFDGDYEEEEQGSSFSASSSWDQTFDYEEEEPWFAKVSRAYWYVLPLILASMVLATGPQAFLLAMAVPLAQSAASFAIRAFSSTFGRNQEDYDDDDDYYDYRSGWEASEEQGYNSTSYSTKYRQGSSSSSRNKQQQPWAKDDMPEVSEPSQEPNDTDVFNATSSNTSRTGFGGWDELDGAGDDQYIRSTRRCAGAAPPPDAAADNTATDGAEISVGSVGRRRMPQPETTTRRRRPSRRAAARYTQSPLLMRLLVAVFPFLGSWFRIRL